MAAFAVFAPDLKNTMVEIGLDRRNHYLEEVPTGRYSSVLRYEMAMILSEDGQVAFWTCPVGRRNQREPPFRQLLE